MIHEIHPVGPLRMNCSILGDENSHEAIVVDPGDEVDGLLLRLGRLGLKVKQIVLTHAHIDHAGGAMQMKRATGAPLLLHEQDFELLCALPDQARWLGAPEPESVIIDKPLAEGDTVSFGPYTAKVLHTPGHTMGSICLYFEAEKLLIAGDTLFAGSVGRTDLPGGSSEALMRSLEEKLSKLPDAVAVVPGHGPTTTIGDEKLDNPYMRFD